MRRRPQWALFAMVAVATAILGVAAIATPPAAPTPPFRIVDHLDRPPAPSERNLPAMLQPVVRRFDFDGVRDGANGLPTEFYRYVDPRQGYPPFGEMRVVHGKESAAGVSASGGALRFDLLGGSMSARIGASVVPVAPMADYMVSCRVRTEDLNHAKARLVAWLCDSSGSAIAGSRVESRPADANGVWDELAIVVHGESTAAVNLVFELLLAQPQRPPAQARDNLEPQMRDVRGRAWFDDVVISHLPQLRLEMRSPHPLVMHGDSACFDVQIRGLNSAASTARLRLVGIDGRVAFDHSFIAPCRTAARIISVPLDRCGWYQAVLDVTSDDGVVRQRRLEFLLVPQPLSAAAGRGHLGPGPQPRLTTAAPGR